MKVRSSIVGFVLCLLLGCGWGTEQGTQGSDSAGASKKLSGKAVYQKFCRSCHGEDGALGLSGAKDLTESTLHMDTTIKVISEGRKSMVAYKNVLTPREIKVVAQYVHTLRE